MAFISSLYRSSTASRGPGEVTQGLVVAGAVGSLPFGWDLGVPGWPGALWGEGTGELAYKAFERVQERLVSSSQFWVLEVHDVLAEGVQGGLQPVGEPNGGPVQGLAPGQRDQPGLVGWQNLNDPSHLGTVGCARRHDPPLPAVCDEEGVHRVVHGPAVLLERYAVKGSQAFRTS
ncbi:hypothetical protein AB0953_30845 [Streptomyces sp. NPDC046866]|uniref:hypothetical protein n=1 Tax=Streptomyces sp. NPDC046866 TaxID=3154921 RepID=UPI003451B6C9